jgi:hypothetical protein
LQNASGWEEDDRGEGIPCLNHDTSCKMTDFCLKLDDVYYNPFL